MNNVTKEQFKKALENNRVLVTGTKHTANGWTNFRVFIMENDELIEVNVKTIYSNKKEWGYKCTATGTNRILEIILSIGRKLELGFDEIKQKWQWLSES